MDKHKISDICDLNLSAISKKDRFEEILYLDTSSITCNTISLLQSIKTQDAPSRAKRKVRNNTIVYSTVRPNLKHYGILKEPDDNLIVSTGFTTIDVKEEYKGIICPDFVYLLLSNQPIVDHLTRIADTSVSSYPSINPDDIGDLFFSFPGFDTQVAIAQTLMPLEDKISQNIHINAELEAIAKRLYDYWFVQFDFPNENGKPYKSSGGKMVYNDKLKRDIPERWEIKTIEQIAKTPKTSINPYEYPDKTFKHYSIPAYDECGTYLHEKGASIQSNKYIVNRGQVLAPKLNPWYNRIILVDNSVDSICSTEYVILDSVEEYIRGFLYYLVKTSSFVAYCTKGSTGTSHSQRRVPPDVLKSYTFPFNSKIVESYTSCILPQIEMINQNLNENKQLMKLRDSLLPMLMNGQVTIE